jgi:DNA repair protein RecN (Recombination protein N)
MLQHIAVKNLIIVRSMEQELGPGLTVLTGSTGAGKSILIDALGLILGDKADQSMIREGCDKAEISASFDISSRPEIVDWLNTQSLDSDGECIIRRVLIRNGRSRAQINGSPVPQKLILELGNLLVDIHGQHAHQSLLRKAEQRKLLDAYAGNDQLVYELGIAFRRFREAQAELKQQIERGNQNGEALEFVRFQINELEDFNLLENELESLENIHRKLANAEQTLAELHEAKALLISSDEAVQDKLNRALNLTSVLSSKEPILSSARELLATALIEIEEASTQICSVFDDIKADPEELERADQRLADIHQMARRFRTEPHLLHTRLDELRQELQALENIDSHRDALENNVAQFKDNYCAIAQNVSDFRKQAATLLADSVTALLQELGLAGSVFRCAVSAKEESVYGIDDIQFEISTNPGQSLAPLEKIASGGELSRIGLAIQVASNNYKPAPTLIFDEVDAGIGGATAEIVGKLLTRLSTQSQILCITHLAQIASQGEQHLLVKKESTDQFSETIFKSISAQERVKEIARMIGGVEITDQTLNHAREMLDTGQTQSLSR